MAGMKELTESHQVDFVDDNCEVNRSETNHHLFCQPIPAVEAQEEQTGGDHGELPDPEMIPVSVHGRLDDGVGFPSPQVHDHHGEQGIEDVQAGNGNQEEKRGGAVPVVLSSSEKSIIAESRSGPSAPFDKNLGVRVIQGISPFCGRKEGDACLRSYRQEKGKS